MSRISWIHLWHWQLHLDSSLSLKRVSFQRLDWKALFALIDFSRGVLQIACYILCAIEKTLVKRLAISESRFGLLREKKNRRVFSNNTCHITVWRLIDDGICFCISASSRVFISQNLAVTQPVFCSLIRIHIRKPKQHSRSSPRNATCRYTIFFSIWMHSVYIYVEYVRTTLSQDCIKTNYFLQGYLLARCSHRQLYHWQSGTEMRALHASSIRHGWSRNRGLEPTGEQWFRTTSLFLIYFNYLRSSPSS